MNITPSVSRQDLLARLSHMKDELKSHGRVSDPVASRMPWGVHEVRSFEDQVYDLPQPTLAEMRAYVNARSGDSGQKAFGLGLASLASFAGAILLADYAVGFPLGLVSAATCVGALNCARSASEDARTAQDLTRWEQAFQSAG